MAPPRPGHAFELLTTGEVAYARLMDLIHGAARSIDLTMFILGDDATGHAWSPLSPRALRAGWSFAWCSTRSDRERRSTSEASARPLRWRGARLHAHRAFAHTRAHEPAEPPQVRHFRLRPRVRRRDEPRQQVHGAARVAGAALARRGRRSEGPGGGQPRHCSSRTGCTAGESRLRAATQLQKTREPTRT